MAFSSTLFSLHLILLSTFFTSSYGNFAEQHSATETIHNLNKLTHLHFYFQDIVNGKNPTAARIAGTKDEFPTTAVFDDPLTEGPEPDSKVVGKAQGLYSFAAQDGTSLLMVMSYAFTEGEYKGSTLSILGRNPFVTETVREMPIVGGSGIFRFARGYALENTVDYDEKTGNAVTELNVYVIHGENSKKIPL